MSLSIDQAERFYFESEMLEMAADLNAEKALLGKLTNPELRILLVHYKLAIDARDAKTWPRADMIECLAEHRVSAR